MRLNEYLKKYDVIYYLIDHIETKHRGNGTFNAEYCTIDETNTDIYNGRYTYCWQNTTRLYAYFCYYTSKVCKEKHGYNIYKGKKGDNDIIDWQRFETFFPIGTLWNKAQYRYTENKEVSRKDIDLFRDGTKPKGAEKLEEIINKALQKFFTEYK